MDVPSSVTAQPGNGCVTFEGSDGTKTVTSADLRYRVSANSGTEDGTMPEPGTPVWQQLVDAVHTDATAAEQAKTDAQTAAQRAATSAGNADQSAQEAADSLQELKDGIANGNFKGEKGDKGDTGPAVALDTTLSISGKAADAAKVGEAVGELKQDKLDKPTAPVVGQVLRVKSISDTGEITLETVSGGLPEGGTTGQVLVKKTDAEGDCAWVDPQTATVRTSMDDVALAGAKYILGEQAALSITMPTDAQTGQEIMVVFSSGQTACTLAVDLDDFDFVPKANSMCKIVFLCVAADTWLVDAKEG